jgi:Ca2+-binding EF-hand superfamily protein
MDTRAKNRLFILLATLLFSAAAMDAGAAGNDAFDQLDTNKDGQLNAAEASGDEALSSKWTVADQNQSGAIDRAEFSAFETMLENAVPAEPTTPKSGVE